MVRRGEGNRCESGTVTSSVMWTKEQKAIGRMLRRRSGGRSKVRISAYKKAYFQDEKWTHFCITHSRSCVSFAFPEFSFRNTSSYTHNIVPLAEIVLCFFGTTDL